MYGTCTMHIAVSGICCDMPENSLAWAMKHGIDKYFEYFI